MNKNLIIEWNEEKNELLKKERNISFEEVVINIRTKDILDFMDHPNKEKYPNQKMYIIEIDGYAYMIPCVSDGSKIFLKTIIPSRVLTKKYLR